MKIKTIGKFLKVMTFGKIAGITLAPFAIYVKEEYLERDNLIRHETIHWKQQLESYAISLVLSTLIQLILLFKGVFAWWFIPFVLFPFLTFYVWYVLEWFVRLFINGRAAYKSISFEKEAKFNEYDDGYLEERKPYEWLKYLKKSV